MKLKNVMACAIACVSALMMGVVANAATEVKAEGVTVDSYGAVVPIVLNTTDTDRLSQVSAFEITLNYDTNVWTYDGINDPNTYDAGRGNQAPMGSTVTNPAINKDGTVEIIYYCGGGNGFPTVTDGKLTLSEVYLAPVNGATTAKDTDFSVGINYVADYDGGKNTSYWGTEMDSFFTFDVTGDLGGNDVVGIAVSTDGGVTKKDLDKYVSTTFTGDTETYAEASTKFLVAFSKYQESLGGDVITDVTVYGKLADGTYVPLNDYDQDNFQIQTFYRTGHTN